MVLAAAYFPRAYAQVSSALKVLTSEFGMGSGVAPSLEPPELWCLFVEYFKTKNVGKSNDLLVLLG